MISSSASHYHVSLSSCDGTNTKQRSYTPTFPVDGVEIREENMLGDKGGAKFDPAHVSGSDSDCPEKSVEEVSEPSTLLCGQGRKMQRGSGCDGGRGSGLQTQGTIEEQVRGSSSFCTCDAR